MVEASDHRSIRDDLDTGEALQATQPAQKEALFYIVLSLYIVCEDPPARWRVLNHTIAVNRLLGFENRVAMSNRPAHPPTPESNAAIYDFFTWSLKP